MGRFKQAVRAKARFRMGIDAPAGGGKTVTVLRLAMALADHYGGRVAAIDTERGSMSLEQGRVFGDEKIDFSVTELADYSPDSYTQAIEEAGREKFCVLVIDSLSHAWEGAGGVLEQVDKAKAGNANKFSGWKDVTPKHRRMVDAILTSPCHIFCTMRTKTEYVVEENEHGKKAPRKIGMAPIQRDGMEYEFTVYGSLDLSHTLTITKSRCPAIEGAVVVKPGASFMMGVIRWLEDGTDVPSEAAVAIRPKASDEQMEAIIQTADRAGMTPASLKGEVWSRFTKHELADLTPSEAKELLQRLEIHAKAAAKKAKPATTSQEGAAPAANGHTGPKPTAEQMEKLKGIVPEALRLAMPDADRETRQAAWTERLRKDYGVDSVLKLRPEQAAKLIAEVEHKSALQEIATANGTAGKPPVATGAPAAL